MISKQIDEWAWATVRMLVLGATAGYVTLVGLFGTPAAAQAATITITPRQPTPGEHVTVRGSGFCPDPCSPVTITEDGAVAASNVAVTSSGTFETEIGLAPVSGTTSITASQTDAGGEPISATAVVMIVASDQTGVTTTTPGGGTTTTMPGDTTTVPPGDTTTTMPGATTTQPPTTSPPTTATTSTSAAPGGSGVSWTALAAGLAVMVGALAAALWLLRRRRAT